MCHGNVKSLSVWVTADSQRRCCAVSLQAGVASAIDFPPNHRFHDLRHHAITELAESQASESTVMAIAGHVSAKLLQHYSRVGLQAKKYVRPSFCYKCARPCPWQEERLNIARELLYHDDKLSQDDRDKLWDLLKDVMSNPTDGLVPAKRRLIDLNLAKAGQGTKDALTDLIAKTIAEIVK